MNKIYYIRNYKNLPNRKARTASIVLAIALLTALISPAFYAIAYQPALKIDVHSKKDIDHKSITDKPTKDNDKDSNKQMPKKDENSTKDIDHSHDLQHKDIDRSRDKENEHTFTHSRTPILSLPIVKAPLPTQEIFLTPVPIQEVVTPTPIIVSNRNENKNTNSNDNHTDVNVTNNNNVNITNNVQPQQTATVEATSVENTQVQAVTPVTQLPGTGVPATVYGLFSLLPLGITFRKFAKLG